MIAAAILQSAYNDLYKELRNYIWDYNTVEKLADLETAVYMVFPNLDNVRHALNRLETEVRASDIYEDDEQLQRVIERFENKLDGVDAIYYGLDVPQEVIENDDKEIEFTEPEADDRFDQSEADISSEPEDEQELPEDEEELRNL